MLKVKTINARAHLDWRVRDTVWVLGVWAEIVGALVLFIVLQCQRVWYY